jgi:nicotinamidase/pyrazinamidase
LKRLGHGLDIVLYGVVTEICVAAAARGLLDRGHRVRVVRDAVRGLDDKKAFALFDELLTRGGKLVTTEDVLHARAA